MRKKKIKEFAVVLDIDDTVITFTAYLCNLFNKKYHASISETDVIDWNFKSTEVKMNDGSIVTGRQLRDFFKEYEANGLYAAAPPIRESVWALTLIRKLGYRIILLTARKERFRKDTEINFLLNDIVHDSILFDRKKVDAIRELSSQFNIVAFADDKLEYVEDVSKLDIVQQCYLVTRSHNRSEAIGDNVIRVSDLLEVVRLLPEVNV